MRRMDPRRNPRGFAKIGCDAVGFPTIGFMLLGLFPEGSVMPEELIQQQRAKWHFATGVVVLYAMFTVGMFILRSWVQ